ncbi:MAG: ABC transporter ATP-binding protein [Lachnospiraceae bacterium]|nr:ABC transporter ATP-binding protein [Lachnospiraceae bacterium]
MDKIFEVLKRYKRMLVKGYRLDKAFFVSKILMTFYSSIITFIGIVIPKYMLSAIENRSIKRAIIVLGISFAISMIGSIIDRLYSPYSSVAVEKMNVKITEAFLDKSFSLKISYFENAEAYNNYSVAFDNCSGVVHSAVDIFFGTFSAVINLVMAFSILAWMNKGVLVFMLFIVVVQLLIDRKRKKIMFDYQLEVNRDNRQLNYLYRLFYVPQFMRDIRVNSLKDFVYKKKKEATDGIVEKAGKMSKKIGNVSLKVAILSHVETFLTSLYFIFETVRGTVALGDFFVALNSYSTIKSAIASILSSCNSIYENDLYITHYENFMNEPELSDNSDAVRLDRIDRIEFRNVSFTYPNGVSESISDLSFVIEKNQKVAIVGCNGAGKTTIVKLLLRLYEPSRGEILINNRNIKDFQVVSLRATIGVLFQDYSIYPFSIRDNVQVGKTVSTEKIEDALRKVRMLNKVLSLKNGLDTAITNQMEDEGVELSGGEAQRIAIARMYTCACPTIILDEPTSSLDPIIENELYDTILDDSKDKTVIIISHRLAFTYKMDKIICMQNGCKVEEGTHNELIKIENGNYRSMVEVNTKRYA